MIAVIENLREEAHSGTEQDIQSTEIVLSTEVKKDLSLLRDTDLASYLVLVAKKTSPEKVQTRRVTKRKSLLRLFSFVGFCVPLPYGNS